MSGDDVSGAIERWRRRLIAARRPAVASPGALSLAPKSDDGALSIASGTGAVSRVDAAPTQGEPAGRIDDSGANLPACRECGDFELCVHDVGEEG